MSLRSLFAFFAFFALLGGAQGSAQAEVGQGLPAPLKQTVAPPPFSHEVWGRTHRGDGYVYGPTYRSSGVAVADLDLDGDNDFAVPGDVTTDYAPQVLRNLGTSGAFYPGGLRDLTLTDTPASSYLSLSMDFADVNGDGLPDMLCVLNDFANSQKGVAWYRNLGPVDQPVFRFVRYLYTSSQTTFPGMWVDWADIDNDGKQDVFFIEAFVNASSNHHRVYYVRNTGSATSPSWTQANVQQVTALTALMPPRIVDGAKSGSLNADAEIPRSQDVMAGLQAKATYAYRIGDFELADWNADGDLDFMFYDKAEGIHWIRNVGTPEIPSWDNAVASAGAPLYDHREDGMDYAEGTFALRPNPDAVRARSDWLDELYISVSGWLMTWRYFIPTEAKAGDRQLKDFVDTSSYRLIQENSTAYPAGQSSPAFWDYDLDGDLDLFRMGVGTGTHSYLLLFPNIGASYAPAWGELSVVRDDAVTFAVGTAANGYRQDLYTIADHDGVAGPDLFVQGQDGRVKLYWAYPADEVDPLPLFDLHDANYGNVLFAGETGIQPRGIALANFNVNDTTNNWHEMIIAYRSDQGGKIVYYDTYHGTRLDLSGDTGTDYFLDENNDPISPNAIENLAATDIDGDGRPDLVMTTGTGGFYQNTVHRVYRNVQGIDKFYFQHIGFIEAPPEIDPYHSRLAAFADIDADGDDDLFIGHTKYWQDGNEPSHHLRFYRNGTDNGLRFWRTRAVSGQSWYLRVGGVYPDYDWVTNASGGLIAADSKYTAGPLAGVVDILDSSNNYRVYVDVLPPVPPGESKAILVVGGDPADPLYPTFKQLAGYAYWVLRMEGLPANNIRLLSSQSIDADEDGTNDRYASPSLASLESSIKTWSPGAERLLVYFVDHGLRDKFRLNATEYLGAAMYNAWLNTLQGGGGLPQVTTVIDTCEAGSFTDNLATVKDGEKAVAQRITITSSNIGPIEGVALFDSVQDISFSLTFWRALFNGETYGEAFDTAKVAIESINPLQRPQIDDDGDGIANEANDGLLAKSARPGADFELSLPGVYVGEVAPNQAISGNSATLWLADVVAIFPVEGAGALIVPPNFQRDAGAGDDEQPVTGLDWVDFTYNANLGRWQANYGGFTEGGLYRIQYYVSAGGRYHPSPRIGFVDRIGIADAWETDNSFETANWMPVNSVQGHNFHAANDADWMRFVSPSSGTATIAVLAPAHRCSPVVQLYRQRDLLSNPSASPVREVSGGPAEEVVFTHAFQASEAYLLRVANQDGSVYGAGTSYLSIVAVGTGGLIPSTVFVTTLSSLNQAPLKGTAVTFDNSIAINTTADGVALFVCNGFGNYNIAAAKAGYEAANRVVNVNKSVENVTMALTPSGGGSTDVNGNGEINAVDVQLVINEALGISTGYSGDIDANGLVNAVDVQLVINGALGLLK